MKKIMMSGVLAATLLLGNLNVFAGCPNTCDNDTCKPYVVQAYDKVADWNVNAYNQTKTGVVNTYDTVSNGAVQVYNKVADGTVNAYDQTKTGVVNASNTVAQGTVTTYNKAAAGTKQVYKKTQDGVEKAYNKTKHVFKKIF